jgi:uncharacterized protein YlxW (UPF0749 family)
MLVEFVLPIVIVAIVASMVASIVRSATAAKHQAQRAGGDAEQQRRLEESVLELTDQVTQLRTEVMDLGERMDFAERVLVRGREDGRLPERH